MGYEGQMIDTAAFDMQGTTVQEQATPLVILAYDTTLKHQAEIALTPEQLKDLRGFSKIDGLKAMVYRHGDAGMHNPEEDAETRARRYAAMDEDLKKFDSAWVSDAQAAFAQDLLDEHFTPALLANLDSVNSMPGATDTFRYLREHGVYVGVATGFPEPVAVAITEHLGWVAQGVVDYATCDARAGGSRKGHYHLTDILAAGGRIPADSDKSIVPADYDPKRLLKVGDTETDMREGLNFGATTVGVLSGGHDRKRLEKVVKSDMIIPSVADLPRFLEERGFVFKK